MDIFHQVTSDVFGLVVRVFDANDLVRSEMCKISDECVLIGAAVQKLVL